MKKRALSKGVKEQAFINCDGFCQCQNPKHIGACSNPIERNNCFFCKVYSNVPDDVTGYIKVICPDCARHCYPRIHAHVPQEYLQENLLHQNPQIKNVAIAR